MAGASLAAFLFVSLLALCKIYVYCSRALHIFLILILVGSAATVLRYLYKLYFLVIYDVIPGSIWFS